MGAGMRLVGCEQDWKRKSSTKKTASRVSTRAKSVSGNSEVLASGRGTKTMLERLNGERVDESAGSLEAVVEACSEGMDGNGNASDCPKGNECEEVSGLMPSGSGVNVGECSGADVGRGMGCLAGDGLSEWFAKKRARVYEMMCRMKPEDFVTMIDTLAEYESLAREMEVVNERLSGVNEGLREGMREMQSVVVERPVVSGATASASMAAVAAAFPTIPVRRAARPTSYAVVVKSALQDGQPVVPVEGLKEKVLEAGGAVSQIKVKAVRRVRDGVAVEVTSSAEVEMLEANKQFAELGLVLTSPQRPAPKIMIRDVPKEVNNECLLNELFEKNLEGIVEKEECMKSRVLKRMGRDGCSENVVLTVTEKVNEHLLNAGRVFIKWSYVRVKEFEDVQRCHKCAAYGHLMRECRSATRLCRRCGQNGHFAKNCEQELACRNCRMRGWPAEHSVLSRGCPMYVQMAERMRNRIIG